MTMQISLTGALFFFLVQGILDFSLERNLKLSLLSFIALYVICSVARLLYLQIKAHLVQLEEERRQQELQKSDENENAREVTNALSQLLTSTKLS